MRGGQTSALVVSQDGIAPCVLENHGKVTAIIEDKYMEIKQLGYLDHGTGQHQSNTVYDTNGIVPSITTLEKGGTQQIKIMEEPKVIQKIGDRGTDNYSCHEYANCLSVSPMSDRNQMVVEPEVMGILEEPRCNVVGSLDTSFESTGRVYSPTGISPCLNTCGGGNLQPKIIDEQNMCIRTDGTVGTLTTDGSSPKHNNRIAIRQATEQGYIECELGGIADFSFPDSKDRRGRVQEGGRCSPALTSGGIAGLHRIETRYRIRKLTPKECYRLMGFTDEEFDKAQKVNCNSQLYKQAGNSIVVDVLAALFQEIINADGTVNDHKGEQINLFDLL